MALLAMLHQEIVEIPEKLLILLPELLDSELIELTLTPKATRALSLLQQQNINGKIEKPVKVVPTKKHKPTFPKSNGINTFPGMLLTAYIAHGYSAQKAADASKDWLGKSINMQKFLLEFRNELERDKVIIAGEETWKMPVKDLKDLLKLYPEEAKTYYKKGFKEDSIALHQKHSLSI